MKNPDRQAVMMNDYQSFSFGNSICSPVLSAKHGNGFKAFQEKAQSCSLCKAKQQSPLNLSGLYLFSLILPHFTVIVYRNGNIGCYELDCSDSRRSL